ncbi:MAG: heterodisulfide reductase-related iron-sulfur binding cluster [Candidatus Marinimicrobia bacterium]|jgi:glycolate oxidase iron-sulfur subunit|nr:heterodisulfide reductase-related iron-sulfur binding cluster [Candidatus Neomarinimicrobiota bacterium]MDP6966143.1 heterodisulfide reductase-related iron-sulfur binding cluster [Candidatus Neomarinimicrobiota bacterium]|tara:strand:+ start:4457 stop:5767 length:1311 start_codon:yes stop_codon:yes gene_type:complete
MNSKAQILSQNTIAGTFGQGEKDLLRECIHCGFCLPACPTYVTNGMEMDSPRGRLYLMEAAMDRRTDVSDTFLQHIDLCLVCRACESACPSGVQFGNLMETTRATVFNDERETSFLRSLFLRMIVPSHRLLSLLFGLTRIYQRWGLQWLTTHTPVRMLMPKKLSQLQASLPQIPEHRFNRGSSKIFPSVAPRRGAVILFTGCVMDHLYPHVHAATVRLLRWNGYDVVVPAGQTCCGALHAHVGDEISVRNLAHRNSTVFAAENVDTVIVNAAGCGAQMKEYPQILRDESTSVSVADVTEFLFDRGLRAAQAKLEMKIVYDEPCHLIHAQGVSKEPKALLSSIAGIELVALKEADRCCGGAGSYIITQTNMSRELLKRKMRFIEASGADCVVTANPGCQIQLEWGARQYDLNMEVLHIVELLDRAYRADSDYAEFFS